MALAQDLLPVLEHCRSIPGQIGLREHAVYLLEGTWSGDNTGGDVAEGEDCIVSLIPDMMDIAGTCQTDGSECDGGYIEGAESGNCEDGLDCCIATNQCELLMMGMALCQESECTSSFGFQAGCPGGQWCCSVFK